MRLLKFLMVSEGVGAVVILRLYGRINAPLLIMGIFLFGLIGFLVESLTSRRNRIPLSKTPKREIDGLAIGAPLGVILYLIFFGVFFGSPLPIIRIGMIAMLKVFMGWNGLDWLVAFFVVAALVWSFRTNKAKD